ncbi:MAG: class I SAM-dependent rRNA methyltransferase [Planctomycetes bacterium]|nr:class I SAM-dependent rRNA methyltransferase [Planctomycetota bacterium]
MSGTSDENQEPVIRLRRQFRGGGIHPWVFRRAIRRPPAGLRDGDEVLIVSADAVPVGRGFYHGESTIAVRILSSDPEERLGAEFLRGRLERAASLRRDVLQLDRQTDAYRVVHAEGDGLSGLVVDRYGDLLVVELFSKGFFLRRDLIREILLDLFPGSRCVFRVEPVAGERERMQLPAPSTAESEDAGEVEIREAKLRFLVSPGGHKTGFFLDQRDNRRRFAALVKGKKVLDAFSYTGGFAIAARTRGKAARVAAVDLDEKAVAQGRRNCRLNRAEIEWTHADAFRYLRNQRHAVEPFDAICVDPPKWALDRKSLDDAERKYLDINTYALRALRRGGVLLTCSCSGLVSEEWFLRILHRAAADAGRSLQVFLVAGAAGDHPVDIHCPESRYLKAVFARAL